MNRHPGVDEHGRPIVAELGRAETPQEAAERKAAASARRRGAQTVPSLVIAIIASLGVVAFFVLVVVRPDSQAVREPVDIAAVAANAQAGAEASLVVPELPEGWWANRAQFDPIPHDGVVTWELGIITADDGYLSVTQGIDANTSWVADLVVAAPPEGTVSIGGVTWTTYDRRDFDDPGNMAYALVAEAEDSTVVVGGTASEDEYEQLAGLIAKELRP